MALSEDQKAMLRLLAQREQGYDDLAALMGLSVEEVRSRVKQALEQLEAEGAEAPAVEPPFEAPAPAAAPPVEDVAATPASEPVREPVAKQDEAAAAASAAEAAPGAGEEPANTANAGPKGPGRPRPALPKDRGVQIAIIAGLLALIAVVVLLAVGSDSGSSGGTAASGSSPSASNASAGEGSELTQAILSPVGGGGGEGRAIFGRVQKNVVVQVEATGLKPTSKGTAYTVWLYKSPKLALRIGAVRAPKGGISAQLPIPAELLAYVASGAFDQIDIALTEDSAYAAEVAKAKKEKRLPEHVGESVLRGEIKGPAVKK